MIGITLQTNKSFLNTYCAVLEWMQVHIPLNAKLSLDTETTGIEYDCKLKGYSLCTGESALYVNLNDNPEFDLLVNALRTLLTTKVNLLIMQNAPFDLRVLRSCEINYSGDIFDTQVAAHLLNENAGCALKKLAIRVLKVPREEVLEYKDAIKFGIDSERFLNYAINDSIWTWQLYELELPLLEKQGLSNLFWKIEMPFQWVLIDMYHNGIKIDAKRLEDFEDIVTEKMQQFQVKAIESIGLKMKEEKDLFGFTTISSPMNLNSDEQVAKVIEGKFKIKLPRTEPSKTYPNGQPSTASDALEPHKDKCNFIEYLLKFRKADKLLNTFITPMWEHICKDGRIRTSLNDCVARTGRLSSSEPNLQNIPRELSKEDLVNIRELFVAKDGYTFVVADYDSQELRQLANLTMDANLIDAFNKNKDLHLFTANSCLNLGICDDYIIKTNEYYGETKKKYKEERHIGKNGINFPIVYGSTAYGIAKNNKVTKEVAQSWLDGFFKTYPGVEKSLKECKRTMYQKRFVTNYFGRRRRFLAEDFDPVKGVKPGAVRQGFNFLIQGFCADLLRLTLAALRQLYLENPHWDAKLVLTVHDDCITECRKEFAQDVLAAKKKVMESVINLAVPFLVEIKVCESYAG
jgi:DNA polymerase-1